MEASCTKNNAPSHFFPLPALASLSPPFRPSIICQFNAIQISTSSTCIARQQTRVISEIRQDGKSQYSSSLRRCAARTNPTTSHPTPPSSPRRIKYRHPLFDLIDHHQTFNKKLLNCCANRQPDGNFSSHRVPIWLVSPCLMGLSHPEGHDGTRHIKRLHYEVEPLYPGGILNRLGASPFLGSDDKTKYYEMLAEPNADCPL